jgi:hypothetical protein
MLFSFTYLIHAWRAVLPLVIAMFLTTGRASAECGDYVTIKTSAHPSNVHRESGLPPADSKSSGIPQIPCHGPNCSQSPTHIPSPLAPITVASEQVKELAQLFISRNEMLNRRLSFDRDDSFIHPIRRASSVFHPPRIAC